MACSLESKHVTLISCQIARFKNHENARDSLSNYNTNKGIALKQWVHGLLIIKYDIFKAEREGK